MTEDERKKKIAADGEKVSVRMTMMDSLQAADRAIREVSVPIMHRPGFVTLSDSDRQRKTELQRRYEKSLADRFANPHEHHIAGHALAQSANTGKDAAAAYSRYDQRIQQAWRREQQAHAKGLRAANT